MELHAEGESLLGLRQWGQADWEGYLCWDQLASRSGVETWADYLGSRTEEGKNQVM